MDTKTGTNDADTEQNVETVTGLHAQLTCTARSRMYVTNLFSARIISFIVHAPIKFYFYLVKLETRLANLSIKRFNWFGLTRCAT